MLSLCMQFDDDVHAKCKWVLPGNNTLTHYRPTHGTVRKNRHDIQNTTKVEQPVLFSPAKCFARCFGKHKQLINSIIFKKKIKSAKRNPQHLYKYEPLSRTPGSYTGSTKLSNTTSTLFLSEIIAKLEKTQGQTLYPTSSRSNNKPTNDRPTTDVLRTEGAEATLCVCTCVCVCV